MTLQEHGILFTNFFGATLAALLVGKAVLVIDNLRFMHRFDGALLIQPILFKSTDLRLVRDKMEHSTIAITVDLYGQHVHPDCQTRAVEGLDRALNLAPRRHPAPPEGENAG